MIVPKTKQPPFTADLSSLTEEQQENILSRTKTELDGEVMYEVTFNDKYERNLLKEENKRLKEEIKRQKHRITEATDFADLKTKVTKVKDSEQTPTKWSDKVELLAGEIIDHKGILYEVLVDHTASKDREPPQEELYKQL